MSTGDESSSDETENETGEDIGILDEAWDYEDGLTEDNSEDDLGQTLKDPDWNANMEEDETDESDDDELDETEDKDDNASQDGRKVFIHLLTILFQVLTTTDWLCSLPDWLIVNQNLLCCTVCWFHCFHCSVSSARQGRLVLMSKFMEQWR